jgi:hypothetical protein
MNPLLRCAEGKCRDIDRGRRRGSQRFRLRVLPDRDRDPPLDERLLEPDDLDDDDERPEEDDERPTDQVLRLERLEERPPPQLYEDPWPIPPVRMVKTSSQSKPPPP